MIRPVTREYDFGPMLLRFHRAGDAWVSDLVIDGERIKIRVKPFMRDRWIGRYCVENVVIRSDASVTIELALMALYERVRLIKPGRLWK